MEFLFLVLIFIILGLLISAAWYLLPYLLILWLIMYIIRYFRNRKIRKQISETYSTFFDQVNSAARNQSSFYTNPQSGSGTKVEIEARKPREDSIDVEYVEYDEPNSNQV